MEADEIINCFITKVHIIYDFIKREWGFNDILIRKNKNEIPYANIDIKKSEIKRYSFHGFGCLFKFNKFEIDVELLDDAVGFTTWSVFKFVQKLNEDITEEEVYGILLEKEKLGILKRQKENFIFIPETHSV